MNVPLLIGSTAVLGAFLALWWAVTGARPARAGVNLQDVRRPAGLDLRAATLQRDMGERALEPLVARLAGLTRRYTPRGRIAGLEQRLLLAGASGGWTLERVLAVKALFALTGGALALCRLLLAPSLLGVLLSLASISSPSPSRPASASTPPSPAWPSLARDLWPPSSPG